MMLLSVLTVMLQLVTMELSLIHLCASEKLMSFPPGTSFILISNITFLILF